MYVLLHVIYFLKLSYFEITSDYFLNKHDRATYVSQSETKRNVCFFFFFKADNKPTVWRQCDGIRGVLCEHLCWHLPAPGWLEDSVLKFIF